MWYVDRSDRTASDERGKMIETNPTESQNGGCCFDAKPKARSLMNDDH